MTKSENPSDIVARYVDLLRRSSASPEIAAFSLSTILRPKDPSRPCALVFSPHPDDECLTGILPLRLKQELNWQIINVAVTLGSDVERRLQRNQELSKACAVLGIECVLTDDQGFSEVNHETRQENASEWRRMVAKISDLIGRYQPVAIFTPHMHDAHPTHIGAHLLTMDALSRQAPSFSCSLIQTEYWHPLAEPNLLVGASEPDVARLLAALACHEGENARNPFDVRFPAYLIDNVRRGSERVAGKGMKGAALNFAMLYRIGLWRTGKYMPSALSRIFSDLDSLAPLFD